MRAIATGAFAMSARGWGLRDWLLTEVQLARISCAGGMPIGRRADAMDVDDARGALCRPPSHDWFAHGRAGATVTRALPHLFGGSWSQDHRGRNLYSLQLRAWADLASIGGTAARCR